MNLIRIVVEGSWQHGGNREAIGAWGSRLLSVSAKERQASHDDCPAGRHPK